jgi:hypothetical protein
MNTWAINLNRSEPLEDGATRLRHILGLKSESSTGGKITFKFDCGMVVIIDNKRGY